MRAPAYAGALSRSAAAAAASTTGRFTVSDRAASAVRSHERVPVMDRRHERLLDRARADPADQVPQRSRLVVGARCACTSERLLADNGAGRLVVHVEVAGRIPELLLGELDRVALASEDSSGQSVR